jgi:hypothetical protein
MGPGNGDAALKRHAGPSARGSAGAGAAPCARSVWREAALLRPAWRHASLRLRAQCLHGRSQLPAAAQSPRRGSAAAALLYPRPPKHLRWRAQTAPGHSIAIPLSPAGLLELPAPQPWWRLHGSFAAGLQHLFADPQEALAGLEQSLQAAFTVGWIGSPFTAPFLQALVEPLHRFAHQQPARLLVVGGPAPAIPTSPVGANVESVPPTCSLLA